MMLAILVIVGVAVLGVKLLAGGPSTPVVSVSVPGAPSSAPPVIVVPRTPTAPEAFAALTGLRAFLSSRGLTDAEVEAMCGPITAHLLKPKADA